MSSKQNGDNKYREIPTLPTTLEQAKDAVTRIINKLEEIDFKALIASLESTVDGIKRTVNSPDLELDDSLSDADHA